MPSAWRLTKTRHVSTAWDGEGAKRAGGRWNSTGVAVVYASETLALALVEILVHLSSGVLPAYSALPIQFDDSLVTRLTAEELPSNWQGYPPPAETRAIGDQWVARGTTPVLRVPSVVVPWEFNYLLNPAHPDFAKIRKGAPIPFPFDPRLVKVRGASH